MVDLVGKFRPPLHRQHVGPIHFMSEDELASHLLKECPDLRRLDIRRVLFEDIALDVIRVCRCDP
eukprot:5268266-Pyramimonas_sp.AAC.1